MDKMIDLIIQKGQKGFVGLVESLKEESMEIVQKLNMSLEEEYCKAFRMYIYEFLLLNYYWYRQSE